MRGNYLYTDMYNHRKVCFLALGINTTIISLLEHQIYEGKRIPRAN
jgi:hypothetical protein